MIRYDTTAKKLRDSIEVHKPGWLKRASDRTKTFKSAGRYNESSTIWSEIKPVYMRLQHYKCAYCEKELEGEERGKGEHDVEHFRPKSSVTKWHPKAIRDAGIPITPPMAGNKDPGYHLLPYHLLNYTTACRSCNSTLKGDKFPIAGKRDPGGSSPASLKSERAYLIYPIGRIDDDPAKLIRFYGVSPQAAVASGHKHHRALVTIAFFELDDPVNRKTLFKQRARIIRALYRFLNNHRLKGGGFIYD